ncbi:MAG: arginine--tRNA ligase [Candidatus Spyradocola sp.]|nr:arginine--tRNA ligase [Candidatus Spyradocola sp.]
MEFKEYIAGKITEAMEIVFGQSVDGVEGFLETPPNPDMGDFAFPCFKLSRTLRMGPPAIAGKLSAAISSDEVIDRVECVGGYLNFFLHKSGYAQSIVERVLQQGDKYGSSDEGQGRVICIDYSSINIAKRFHIGHLSTTMIGNALYKIYEHLGYKCVGINHLGDWGTQFGKMIAAYLKWGSREEVEQGGVNALVALYVRFHKEAEADPSLEDEGRLWFKKIEDGDPQAVEIFTWFKDVTLRDAERVYDMLGVKFDSYAGESFYNDKMQPVIDELREKGLLEESQGAYVVNLEEDGMPPCLILKKDGATLYATRDLAAAFYRKKTYDFYKTLYVVAYQQNLHFKQWFKVVEKMGYDWAKNLEHVAFGMVSYEGRALSTREGYVVYLDELLERAVEKARVIIDEKSPNLADKDKVARQVGIGAVVFFDLFNNRIKDIDFRWERALNFDGETGPYVQYTHARCCSVLAKAGKITAAPDYSALDNPTAQEVVRTLERFPEVVHEACQRNEPSLVTRFSVELASNFNRFYYENHILVEDPAQSAARVNLTAATASCIRTALSLIGVEAPEKM